MITYFLIFLNSLFYIIPSLSDSTLDPHYGDPTNPNYNKLMNFGGVRHMALENGEYYRLASSMFLHFGIIHFLMNMYTLYNMGPAVEQSFGSMRMLILYILAGLGGGVATYFLGPLIGENPGALSAGASGAIFGLIGALIMYVYLNPNVFQPGLIQQLVGLAAINIIFGFTSNAGNSTSSIGNSAHIGGLVVGLLVAFIFGQ